MANRKHPPGVPGFDNDETTRPGGGPEVGPMGDFDEDGGTIVDGAAGHQASAPDETAAGANPDPALFPDPEDTLPPGAAQEIQDQLDAELRRQHLADLGAEDDPIPEPLSDPTRPA